MSISNNHPPLTVLLDHESLATSIESILRGEDYAPDALAGLFIEFKEAIDSGLQGIVRASEALLEAVEVTYLHSRAHDAALKLYLLSKHGQLKVEDEPVRLINAAISRSTVGRGVSGKGRQTGRR